MSTACEDRRILAGHLLPFLCWIGVIFAVQLCEKLGFYHRLLWPWSYAFKTVVCAVLVWLLKPWRVYSALEIRNIIPAIAAGLFVALVWILPETGWVGNVMPRVSEFYNRWLIMMPGALPSYYPELLPNHVSKSYSPQEAGWFLTIFKLIGSCCVIAVIEEFFFRGFLYRWQSNVKFWRQPLTDFDFQPFIITVLVFALEHDRWFAGILAGVVYGGLVVLRGDIWAAALAHGITNFVLGLYVISMGKFGFW
jgi:uncharacterized protein